MLDAIADPSASEPIVISPDALAQDLLSLSETGLMAVDAAGRVALANPAACRALGLPAGAPLPDLLAALRADPALRPRAAAVARWLAKPVAPLNLHVANACTLVIEAASRSDGLLLLRLRRSPRAAAPSDQRDPLTGLSNRAWFQTRLESALAEPKSRTAVLLLDLDRFKNVNDSLGHPVGDALLRLVAKRLTTTLRDADVISRLAGDEFAVIMRRPRDPEAVGRRIVALLANPYLIEGASVSIGASVGIAIGPDHGRDAAMLVRAADVALYAAKNGGRGNARLFDHELDLLTRQRHAMAEALRQAIPAAQLELHFQPQVMIDTGALSGFEAFLRWSHPELGMLLPSAFLPVAETTGLIWPIGEWVLERACQAARLWPAELTVSVNVSPQQLLDRERLPRLIKAVLDRTGLAPHRLEIEVSEHALTSHPHVDATLAAVHALGVRVSLDDFGTGYSSLGHLRRFPLHKLKIDRSFIQALGSSEEAGNIVEAVAALGRTMGIVTIAEGVETLDQQDRAKRGGCRAVQGYLLSRPVPASEVDAVIAALSAPAS